MVHKELNILPSDKLKKNGTFTRGIYFSAGNTLKYKRIKIQTMLWVKSTGERKYISIFPSFIIKYNRVSCDLIEFISSNVGKDENVFDYIEDAEDLIECEDILIHSCEKVNRACCTRKFSALLNARYTDVFNLPIEIAKGIAENINTLVFKNINLLLEIAYICHESCILKGPTLSSLNELFKFLR